MKKTLLLMFVILLLVPAGIFAAENSFIEMVAGSIKVKGEKVGVLTTTILSNVYKFGMPVPFTYDDPVANGIKLELINKGASVKVLNPAGMEQIIAQFISVKKGQFSTKEDIASQAGLSFQDGMKNSKADISAGIQLLEKLLDVNEFSDEGDRVSSFSSLYSKIVNLWGVSKIITVTRVNAFSVIVKGYEIDTASATLVFQYEVRASQENWTKIPQWKDEWKISGTYGYTVEDTPGVKYETSFKRTVELIKRISEFLK
jgi:hypothetical protein